MPQRPPVSQIGRVHVNGVARHSTITLTMDHYTHTLIEDERSALARLPELGAKVAEKERARSQPA